MIYTDIDKFIDKPLLDKIKHHLIDGKYMYHYTLVEYVDYIKSEGLIPRKNPNSFYGDSHSSAVFLTVYNTLYKINLPESLMDVMNDYYEDEDSYDEKPLIKLVIDVTKLDEDKFTWDDDYILNKYGWNKAKTKKDKILESLDIWGSIAYLGEISPELIIDYNFEYY